MAACCNARRKTRTQSSLCTKRKRFSADKRGDGRSRTMPRDIRLAKFTRHSKKKHLSYTLSVLNVKGYFNFLRLYDIMKTFMSPQLGAQQCKQYNSWIREEKQTIYVKETYVKHKYDIASLHYTIVSSLHILSFLILLWPPCVADEDIIFPSCGFFLLSFFFCLA